MCALVTGVQTCDLPILRDGKLSLGVLDPLIEELRKRPPRPDAAKPRIVIDDRTLLLTTDYGATRLTTEIGRAARRERECTYASFSVVAVTLTKEKNKITFLLIIDINYKITNKNT